MTVKRGHMEDAMTSPAPPIVAEIPETELFSIPAVAVLFGCSVETVRRLVRAGKLEPTRLSDRSVRIHRDEVERYVRERRAGAA